MARINITEEERLKYSEVMGSELAEVYLALYGEVTGLHLQWNEYMELFGQKNRVEILNKAAGAFFHMVQGLLSDDVMLGIARLTDPPESRGKENLTVKKLPTLVREEYRSEISSKVIEAEEAASFCRDWRNRHFAHRDLDLFLKRDTVDPLEAATIDKLESALKKLADVIQFLAQKYFDTFIIFDKISRMGGAHVLLYVLDDGLKRREERRKRIREGINDPEDHKPRVL